ncbi:MAG TPA: transporter substrate-binding domain-containing protein [Spirochaetes bacterium]|nr:transporter substrate-binding domain-containing protein [Spirochaetota bacterium]
MWPNGGVVYSLAGSDIETLTDLEGKKVALLTKSIHYQPFMDLISSFGISIETIETENNNETFELIQKGIVDAGVANRIFGVTHQQDYRVGKTGIIFNPIEIRYALPKGKNPEIGLAIDRHLKELKDDKHSIYYHSYNKVFGDELGRFLPPWAKWALAIAAAGLFLGPKAGRRLLNC